MKAKNPVSATAIVNSVVVTGRAMNGADGFIFMAPPGSFSQRLSHDLEVRPIRRREGSEPSLSLRRSLFLGCFDAGGIRALASTGSRPEGDASGVPRYKRDGSMMQVGLKALR